MCGALIPDDLLRGFQIVVEDRQSGRRTDIIAKSGSGDHDRAFDAFCMENAVIIIESGNISGSPSFETLLQIRSGKIAADRKSVV